MVYLVDDDADDIEFVQEALSLYNYKGPVATAANGEALLNQLCARDTAVPDVIVLDLNMPLKDGFSALREIRTIPRLSGIPVIILTASSSSDDELKCFELGCNYFFRKPAKLDDYSRLVTTIKKCIDQAA
jgi:CheY-like chemotaxis protein